MSLQAVFSKWLVRRRVPGAALFLILAVAPYSLLASRPDDLSKPAITDFSIEQLMDIEVTTVTGASKFAQKVTEAPSSVTIITAQDIRRFGHRTLADILRSVRGFYVTGDRSYSYIGVRGFSRPGDYNARVLLLVDGHKINDGIYGSASIGREFLDVDLIERIEIIRGPGSSLYGNNAFFGVINVIMKKGSTVGGFELAGAAEDFGTFKERATFGGKSANGIEFLISATHLASEGQDLYFRDFDSPTTNHGVADGCDGETAKSFFGKLAFRDLTLQTAYVSRSKDLPTAPYDTAFNDDRTSQTDKRSYVDVKYSKTFGEGTSFLARLYYDRYRYDAAWVFDDPDFVLNKDIAESTWWGGQLEIGTKLFERHRVTAGMEYESYERQRQLNFDVRPYASYLNDDRGSYVWAAYVQDQITLRKDLLINAGIRYDRYKTFGSTINPRMGLIYTPSENSSMKLLYGTAFRAPNTFENYYADAGISQKPNPNLKPEKIETYELVLEQNIKKYRLSLSGFYYQIEDLISYETDPADGLSIFQNSKTVEAKGGEFEIERRWSHGIEARASYSYTEAVDRDTGRILTNSPRHLAKLNLFVPLFSPKVAAGIELQYTGPRKLRESGTAGGYMVANFTLVGRELLKNLEVSASVYNLFDKAYGDPVSRDFVPSVIHQDGRNWRIKATYRF